MHLESINHVLELDVLCPLSIFFLDILGYTFGCLKKINPTLILEGHAIQRDSELIIFKFLDE